LGASQSLRDSVFSVPVQACVGAIAPLSGDTGMMTVGLPAGMTCRELSASRAIFCRIRFLTLSCMPPLFSAMRHPACIGGYRIAGALA